MYLYLMRHGQADHSSPDEQRELSERGALDVHAVATYLAGQDLEVSRVYHSTLVRAKQTADIMSSILHPQHDPEERGGIEPWGDVDAFARLADSLTEDTLVCGHEPFMGEAARALQPGGSDYLHVKTATVMAFKKTEGGWVMDWLINPKLIQKDAS